MSTEPQLQAETPATAPTPPPDPKARVAALVRWAVRITSLPVLALALVSLYPILSSFSISARDDQIIGLGLCGVCAGYLLGWKWPAIGGAISLAAIGVILAHDDTALSGDPFSISFALQAILFLVSAVVNLRTDKPAAPAFRMVKMAAIGVLACCAVAGAVIIYRGPGPMALPKEKARYVGMWESAVGLTIELTKEGEAKVTQSADSKLPSFNSPIKPGETKIFNVEFQGDDYMALASGALSESKRYHVDRHPHLEGKLMKMTLNASDPYHRTNGFVLVKKLEQKAPIAGSKTNAAASKTNAVASKPNAAALKTNSVQGK